MSRDDRYCSNGRKCEEGSENLSSSAGPSGIDFLSMSYWLLEFSASSAILRKSFADLTEWLANGYPPWAAYRAMTSCRLVALDKYPDVRPIGIGDIMRRLVCKIC